MKNLCIIQARMGSTRLPGKVLLKIKDKTVIEHVVDRVKKSKLIDEIIVATSIDKNNLPLVKICAMNDTRIFVGSEDDVLDRFYQVSKLLKPDNIVRITADCPLIDYKVIDMVIERHLEHNVDYTTNAIRETFPDGIDVEVLKYSALEFAWRDAKLKSEREHVTPYIRKNDELFSKFSVENGVDLSNHRWTLDEKDDFDLICKIYDLLYDDNTYFGINEIVELLNVHPELVKINNHIGRNAGYIKSIKRENP